MTKTAVRTTAALGGALLGAYLYGQWLNVPPTATIPTPVLPSPNGHDALYAATKLVVDKDGVDNAVSRPISKDSHVYTAAEKEHLIAENAPALTAAREALKLDFWNPPARSFTTLFPEFAKFRAMARLLSLESRVKAARGDSAGAVDSALDAVEMGVKVPRGGVLIADLVGIACEAIGDKCIWPQIDHLDADSAARAAQRLEAITDKRFPYADVLQEEKWLGQAGLVTLLNKTSSFGLVRELNTESGMDSNDSSDTSGPTATQAIAAWKSLLTHSKRRIFADYTACMDANIAQAKLPFDISASAVPTPDDPINQILFPIFDKAGFKDAQGRMQDGLLVCALALRAYRMRHNEYPATLKDLVSDGILRTVPTDPFARAFGTPFGYHRVSADKFTLYSIGPDGIDDAGTPIDNSKSTDGMTVPATGRNYPEATDKGDWVVGVDVGKAEVEAAVLPASSRPLK